MILLRSLPLLLLVAVFPACVDDTEPPVGNESGGTTGVADSSTGNTASATSTTGQPPGTSSGGLDSTTVDGTSETTGELFIMKPDGGCFFTGEQQLRCSVECQVGLQDCPEGEKCVPWANDGGNAWNSTRCSPVPENPAGLGEACVAEDSPVSGFDDCDVGALCWEVDPRTLMGTCVALCDPDQFDSCGDDAACAAFNYFQPYVCLARCNPLDPVACAADEVCRAIDDEIVCVPSIVLPQGLECGMEGQYCAPDQACMWADLLASCDDTRCCRPWCDLSAPDPDLPCAAVPGEVCVPWFEEPAPPGYETLGVCALPP